MTFIEQLIVGLISLIYCMLYVMIWAGVYWCFMSGHGLGFPALFCVLVLHVIYLELSKQMRDDKKSNS